MKRLDQWLVEEGHFTSRERARLAIMAGEVEIEGRGSVLKAGTRLRPRDRVIIKRKPRFVSRGGDKLDGALERWNVDVSGLSALDIGASTGGFTDCLLQRGAAKVISLDVGKGQLHWKLRQDNRVTVMEGVNVRFLDECDLPYRPQLVTVDLSFISMRLAFPVISRVMEDKGEVIGLIKPQFEAGKGKVGRKGIVRDPGVHHEVLERVLQAADADGFSLQALAPSILKGADGNVEYLAWWVKVDEASGENFTGRIDEAVNEAWERK
jgi:23S rRNA (cytidine1920-2'-O)/16S rRNA (cytidine1409-2'-O)-methyltransferase